MNILDNIGHDDSTINPTLANVELDCFEKAPGQMRGKKACGRMDGCAWDFDCMRKGGGCCREVDTSASSAAPELKPIAECPICPVGRRRMTPPPHKDCVQVESSRYKLTCPGNIPCCDGETFTTCKVWDWKCPEKPVPVFPCPPCPVGRRRIPAKPLEECKPGWKKVVSSRKKFTCPNNTPCCDGETSKTCEMYKWECPADPEPIKPVYMCPRCPVGRRRALPKPREGCK